MNKIMGIINVILIIVILGLVGYILIDKKIIILNGNVKEEVKEEPNEEKKLDISDSLVEKYFNMYKYFQEECIDEELLNNDNEARLHLVLNEIPASYYQTISCNFLEDLTINNKYYCSNQIYEDFTKDLAKLNYETTTYIKEDIILNKYQELFGQNSIYQKEDIFKFGGMYHYDSKNKAYAYYRINSGGGCPLPEVTLISATVTNNILKLIILKDYDDEYQIQDCKLTINLKYEQETGNYILDNIVKEVQ